MIDEIIHIYTNKSKLNNALRFEFAKKKPKKKKGITNTQLRTISRKLTGVVKTQIRKQRHVDTGKMLRVTKVIATIGARGELVAKIFSTDYWIYVDGNFDILNNAIKTRKWKEIEKEFNTLNEGSNKRNTVVNKHF